MYENPIDLSFMEELLSFVEQDTCCIPHLLLIKYGVFKEKNSSANIKERLEEYEFIENEDYLLLEVQEQSETSRGIKYKKIYYLKPTTFKLMLMRSKCEKKYAKYYLLLEKSIKYYHDYQIVYQNYMLSRKDDKIDELMKKVDNQSDQIKEQSGQIKEQSEQIKELISSSRETTERLSDVEDILEDTKVDLSVVQDKLEIAVEDRAIKPYDKSKVNQIGILRSLEKDKRYYLTCGQKDSVVRSIKRKNYSHVHIDTIDEVPNSIYLFDHIKKQLGSKAKAISRSIQLISIDEPSFIDEIRSLFDGRRNVDLTKRP